MQPKPTPPSHMQAASSRSDGEQGTIDLGRDAVRVKATSVKKLDKIVAEHPDEALNVVRNWLHQEP